ncbi:MAG: hypothetical protein JW915_24595 [Chitinispirillaceae bacterium]|nr:hypothetical protein [Chitinispirillaceae bacterium]
MHTTEGFSETGSSDQCPSRAYSLRNDTFAAIGGFGCNLLNGFCSPGDISIGSIRPSKNICCNFTIKIGHLEPSAPI